eukprot:SAG22_NODE_203_length_15320_cov_14.023516_11_plen_181_part_00
MYGRTGPTVQGPVQLYSCTAVRVSYFEVVARSELDDAGRPVGGPGLKPRTCTGRGCCGCRAGHGQQHRQRRWFVRRGGGSAGVQHVPPRLHRGHGELRRGAGYRVLVRGQPGRLAVRDLQQPFRRRLRRRGRGVVRGRWWCAGGGSRGASAPTDMRPSVPQKMTRSVTHVHASGLQVRQD